MLDFVDVVFSYNDVILLDKINFTIDEGEFVYLTGKSGVGKSTIIRLITGAVKMNSGLITFADFNYRELREKDLPKLRRKLGIVFQDFKFLQDRTIYQNLSYIMEIFGLQEML